MRKASISKLIYIKDSAVDTVNKIRQDLKKINNPLSEKIAIAHMKNAFNYAQLSACERRQVGCIIVKENRIISIGYNGTPPGWSTNCCEDEHGHTSPEVIHAEMNALLKLTRSNESSIGSIMFCTDEPCGQCAPFISMSGITHVYYARKYKAGTSAKVGINGLDFFEKTKTKAIHFPI
jgi:dCMP deaminase